MNELRHRARTAGPRRRPRRLPLPRGPARAWGLAWALAWAVLPGPMVPPAGAQAASEHELKAAFLYHFTQFVEWPAEAFPRPDTPFLICVVGEGDVAEFLTELVAGEQIKGRAIEVRGYGRARDARGCHILFLGAGDDPRDLRDVVGVEQGRVLTVGESAEFLEEGGLLRFRIHRGRIQLQVNESARQGSRLRISSKLLQLCDMVTPERQRRGD